MDFRRYNMYGDISTRAGAELRKPQVADFFARLIQRCAPTEPLYDVGFIFPASCADSEFFALD